MIKTVPSDYNEKIIAFLYPHLSRPNTSRFTPYFFDSSNDSSQKLLYKKGKLFISIENISKGKDQRTSLMIKNLPTNMTKENISSLLNEICKIDYLYIPTNNKNRILGFAFVNVENYKDILKLYDALNSKNVNNKKVEICYSKKQGVNSLVKSFGKEVCSTEQGMVY